MQLHCVVQCYPLCHLVWHRNNSPIPILKERSLNNGGVLIGEGSFDLYSKFVVRTQQKPPNEGENILEHVESTLTLVSFFSRSYFLECSGKSRAKYYRTIMKVCNWW